MKYSGYRILYERNVSKDFKRIDTSLIKRIAEKIESQLLNDPYKGKQLKGEYKGFWSFRIGNYRVVYKIVQKDVVIMSVEHRKKAYK